MRQTRRIFAVLVMFMFCVMGYAQKTIHGTVKDASGEPMIGVTVMLDGGGGTVTDYDGNFTIKNVSDKAKLKISYIGYITQTVPVAGKTQFNIVLAEDKSELQEIVVIGYGTMKKTDLTGSVASIGTEKLVAKGAPSVMENLQGTTPGVSITQSSGRAGGDFAIEIRGKSSINSSTKPMYVVDGVICDDIQFLNPQDIERIDVLKDASSTAIYGSRATAGVVMVTTKGGTNVKKSQKPTISYDGYYGWTKAARMPDFMEADQYYRYRISKFNTQVNTDNQARNHYYMPTTYLDGIQQALILQNSNDFSSPLLLKEYMATGRTYDWPNLVTDDGAQQNHYLSVSGASESVNYHFGVGFNQDKGLYLNDEQKRINFKGSVDAKLNKVISGGFSINLARIDNSYANDAAIQQAYRVNPFMQAYDEDGNINHYPGAKGTLGTNEYQFSDFKSPLDLLKNTKHERETWRVLGNFYLKFDIIKGLDFKTTFSPSYTSYRDGEFSGYINPETGLTYNDDPADSNTATVNNSKSFSYTWDNIVNYNTTIAKDHSIGLMGLASLTHFQSENYKWVATGVMENSDWWNMNSGSFVSQDGSETGYGENSMISYALRANYAYKDRYLFTGTVRWDGSSKFDKDHRWGCFPSLAVAWRITEEEFMHKLDWISNLKLRLSYGVTGNNAGIGNFATIQSMGDATYYPFGSSYVQGMVPGTVVDKEIQWEKSHEWNLGLDFGFLKNRITGSIDIYQKNSKDLLFEVPLPLEIGGVKMTTNIGKVENRGVEISLNTVNFVNKDWNWSTSFTFSHNKNKVKEIDGVSEEWIGNKTTGNLFIGYPVNNAYGYAWDGIVTDGMMTVPDTKIAREKGFEPGKQVRQYDYYFACYGLSEGQPIIRDKNGDGKWDDNDKEIYNSEPSWTGSITSNLSYKNWDFSFSIYTKQDYTVASPFMNSDYYDYHDRGRGKMAMDYYIPAGTLLDIEGINPDGTYINPTYQTTTHYGEYPYPAFGNKTGNADGLGNVRTYWDEAKQFVDASYVKVKHITLGYTFPQKWINHIGCKYFRLYATVTNPFVFTKYRGFDPEWATAATKNDGPSTVTYQIGASIKF